MTAEDIARQWRHELGFVHTQAARRRGELYETITTEHDVIGFVDYHIRRDKQLTIYAIAVARGEQGKGYARRMLHYFAHYPNVTAIVARCPADNASNGFWQHMGFTLVETKPADGKKRAINTYGLGLRGGTL